MLKFCLITFLIITFSIKAIGQLEAALNTAINSDHWEGFYCENGEGEIQLSMIHNNNVLPLFEEIELKGRPIPMKVQISTGEGFVLKVKKCRIKIDQVSFTFIYDRRVKVRMKLIKNEFGEWKVENSIFRQKVACGGKKEKSRFSWTF
ncbi:MAG: hypothetical protein AAF696_33805 [Bacteroidota bacterium]